MTAPVDYEPFIFTARAHAKVNVHLGVAQAREDGFHELASVFQSLDIHDTVTLSEYGPVDKPDTFVAELHVTGPYSAGVPEDASNLAWRAVDAVANHLRATFPQSGSAPSQVGQQPQPLPQVRLELYKNIPAAGGMAGGSADAAAALRVADAFFSPYFGIDTVGEEVLEELAAQLGSDVPFTLMGGTALGTGRGEQLTPMLSRGQYHWVMITSKQGLSTPEVFRKLDELRAAGKGREPSMDTTAVSQALVSGKPECLAQVVENDLQPAAFSLRPDLRKLIETGRAAGALVGIVSGSGPTCALLCADADQAEDVLAEVITQLPGVGGFVATGPSYGARLI